MGRRLARTLLALALVVQMGAALQRYEQARAQICQTGVTSEHIRLYVSRPRAGGIEL